MNYRSPSFALGAQSIRYTGKYNASILKYQKQISSGQRLHRPSDDPVAFRQVNSLTVRLNELRTEEFSIQDAENKLNTSVSQLQESNNLLTSAKLLAQQGISSLSQSERNALAVEAESLLQSLQDISKTKSAGAYLYGGTRSDVLPFEFSNPAAEGGTLGVEYLGSSQHSRAFIGEAVSVETFYAGDVVFGDSQRGDTIHFGDSGAKAGSGTDNIIGRATLQVKHTATTFLGGSGITAGTSTDSDNIIGAAGKYRLTVNDTSGDGSAGTISLDGGSEFAYTSGDTDLEIIGPNGARVSVDTTAITAGFNGTIDIVADGTLSVDGGETTIPIDFTGNQTVTDSTTGRFVHIDTTDVSRSGDDYLDFPGTSDAFQVLYELTQDLRNTRDLDSSELSESLDRRLGELENVADHVLDVMGQQSASLQTLQQLEFRVQDFQLQTETQLSNLQSTDIAEAVLRMQNDQSLLEYTYAITADISSRGLIDFLR